MPVSRREFLARAASGVAVMGVAGCISPAGLAAAQGRAPKRLRVLSADEASTYAAWCDELAIGAADAGVARFVDKHLAEATPDSLLMLRYLQYPPSADFYRGGIASVDAESQARFSKPFLELDTDERKSIVDGAATATTVAWTDPPPPFFYFVSRSDAVDVVYGTVKGFRELGIPYLAHIHPGQPW